MSDVTQLISVCPLCQGKDLKVAAAEIECGNCGSTFELVSDHRQATLRMTLKESRVPGWKNGTTLLSVPNMNLVERTIESLHGT